MRGRGHRHEAWSQQREPEASPVIPKRDLAVVFPQEVQESLVIARLHVEETGHDSIIASGFLQTAADELADMFACEIALHEKRIHRRPKRFLLIDEALV